MLESPTPLNWEEVIGVRARLIFCAHNTSTLSQRSGDPHAHNEQFRRFAEGLGLFFELASKKMDAKDWAMPRGSRHFRQNGGEEAASRVAIAGKVTLGQGGRKKP